jgi:hypothetical protein
MPLSAATSVEGAWGKAVSSEGERTKCIFLNTDYTCKSIKSMLRENLNNIMLSSVWKQYGGCL